MRTDWKYIAYLTAAFGLFLVVKLLSPKQHNWTITYSHEDKNPYGAFALNQVLPAVFSGGIHHSYKTLYELKDSVKATDNIVIITSDFNGGKEDTDVLLNHVAQGGVAFIAAQYFWGHFSDTLQLATYDYFFKGGDILAKKDSAALQFVGHHLDTTARFYYRRENIANYFYRFDTTRTTVVATNENDQPVTLRLTWGKGYFVLNCTPLVFTNIYLLAGQNHTFLAGMLSYLPRSPVAWTEYYHLGRMEIGTPLRFILTHAPLQWAYYITVLSVLLFMVFEAKRKQRIIPVIRPLGNTTLEFVRTIGSLYFQRQDHKNVAEKKIHYLMDLIRSHYWIQTHSLDEDFVVALAGKTGKPEQDVRALVDAMVNIREKEKITARELVDLDKKMERFTLPIFGVQEKKM